MSETMSIIELLEYLPYRYPFLLVDKVVEFTSREFIAAVKNVTVNEPFFQGHFPDNPVMPNGLVLEALVQAASVLLLKDSEFSGRYPTVKMIQSARFDDTVKPGDVLRLEIKVDKIEKNHIQCQGYGLVEGRIVCEVSIQFALIVQPSRPHIHPTASVHSTAELGKDVVVGAYTTIGEDVRIGDRTVLESNIMIEKWTSIGEDCHIHFGAVIGSAPQDVSYKGEKTWVIIGDRNHIREYVTINRSTGKGAVTRIGDDNLLLTSVHIAHNCQLGSHITIANMTNIAGHCNIHDRVILGGMTGVHQFVRIGQGAMVGAYTRLPQDVAPFMLCEGNPAIIRGVNAIGLKRSGRGVAVLKEIKAIYKLYYRSEKNVAQALNDLNAMSMESDEAVVLRDFLNGDSSRGISKKTAAD